MVATKNKWTRGILILVLVSCWGYIAFNIHRYKKQAALSQDIPSIILAATDNRQRSLSDYDSENSLLFIFFNTQCDFCQFELNELGKRVPEFENTEMVLVSAEPLDTLRKFDQKSRFHLYPNVGIYHCPYDTLQKYFGKMASPTTFIYGTDRKILNRFNGATRIDEMLNVIRQAQKSINNSTNE